MADLVPQYDIVIPASEGISLLYNGDDEVIALTISKTGCGNINYGASLIQLESITIDGTQLFITQTIPYGDYYYFEVIPTYLPPTGTGTSIGIGCTEVVFNPFVQGQSFTYSDYNALLGNSQDLRRFNQVFEVDYTSAVSGSLTPSNLTAILSGSAVLAEVQESNYTSIGIANSRYNGAKTSIIDYGVNSAVAATPFQGAVYLSSSADNYICSQSLSDRTIEEYLFTGNFDFPVSGSRIFRLQGNQIIPLRNRKVWGKETNRVFYVDEEGYATSAGSLCS